MKLERFLELNVVYLAAYGKTTEAIVCESSSVGDKLALFRAPFCSLSFSSFRGASL